MKNRYLMVILIVVLVSALIAGCSSGKDPVVNSVAPTSSQTEPIVTESPLTDEELVEKVILSKALQGWGVMSSPIPESAEGVAVLIKNCDEFSILLSRETGLESLKVYGPMFIEKYINDDRSEIRLNALYMERLMEYLFPGQEIEIPVQ